MVCTFFGHRDSPFSLRERLSGTVLELTKKGVKTFIVGNNGRFDLLVQTVLSDLLSYGISVSIILSHIDEFAISGHQELTVFPEQLASVPKRFAIAKRNDYMLKQADFVIFNTFNKASCSYKLLERAQKGKKQIINLAK